MYKPNEINLEFENYLDSNQLNELVKIRASHNQLSPKEQSDFIIKFAILLEGFIIKKFQLEQQILAHKKQYFEFELIYKCKKFFIQKFALQKFTQTDLANYSPEYVFTNEIEFAKYANESNLEMAKYAAWAVLTKEGQEKHKNSILFNFAKKLDYEHLIDYSIENDSIYAKNFHLRDGFSLTDTGFDLQKTLDQANYCIYCHNQNKDSCSKGLKDKDENFRVNSLNNSLKGCPLEEKISEMNFLKSKAFPIAALSVAMVDNPLLAATGYRICNDCMKSCIYQKQEPVNIPAIETRVLTDVLEFDYGFEIYHLLTQWNPIKASKFMPKAASDRNILIVGSGPAGFNLAHYLLHEGHKVVMIEGLKIEPIKIPQEPVKNIKLLYEDLDERFARGFGGVAEYGITVRWNKNNLDLIRIILERNPNFKLYGGVRFGSQITYEIAKNLGFDHIAFAAGSGRPNLPDVNNILAKGSRMASDFLMSLHSTGAANKKLLSNLQIRLPAVVIGGGLTALDTATELMAYYIRMLEKFEQNYDPKLNYNFTDEEQQIVQEFLAHLELFTNEKIKAKSEQRKPNFIRIIQNIGGVKIIYRGKFIDSPAYRLNYEELSHGLSEGVGFVENAIIQDVKLDEYGSISGLTLTDGREINAKTIISAIGTKPNIVLAKEDVNLAELNENDSLKIYDDEGNPYLKEVHGKLKKLSRHFFIKSDNDGFKVSCFGDQHPHYSGNVVKAMASAKDGTDAISSVLQLYNNPNKFSFQELDYCLKSQVSAVNKLADKIYEVIVRAPLAARNFKPGQFFKLQNFVKNAPINQYGQLLLMEALALTGAETKNDEVSMIILEMGGSSDFCKLLKVGEEVSLMGPTGEATEIVTGQKIILVGGGLGNAVLFSIGKALRANKCEVIYFAGYRSKSSLFKQEEIEAAADQIIWCADDGLIKTNRAIDISFHGNIVNAILEYQNSLIFPLNQASRLITIGSDSMMSAVNKVKHVLKPDVDAIASINSPMQCMMKEICAQCIQEHIDPITGVKSYIYSCYKQDQNMNSVNFEHLKSRLSQQSLLEKISRKIISE